MLKSKRTTLVLILLLSALFGLLSFQKLKTTEDIKKILGIENVMPTFEAIPTPTPSVIPNAQINPVVNNTLTHDYDQLLRGLDLTNTDQINGAPFITGDEAADERLVKIATDRGYKLQSVPSVVLANIGEQQLHQSAKDDWLKLQQAALNEGIYLEIVSSYRSIDRQRDLFLGRFIQQSYNKIGREYSYEEIARGDADDVINLVLSTSSLPGFSKHHTGYAIDIADVTAGNNYTDFGQTPGFRWMSENNYENAKKFGFIPSYPEDAENMGPLPEPWEYFWVGTNRLR